MMFVLMKEMKMSNNVLNEMRQRLSNGLNRKSIQSCSRWAEQYRVMGKPFPGPYSFKYHPWAKEMHDSDAEFNVGMKAAQMGFTECVLNVCFYSIDILGEDVLYVLPNAKPDAANFSASRFDSALDLSAHLRTLFSDVQNVGHKRAGAANMFIRGSGARTGLKSISTPIIILDELEEMHQENIPLAFERASGQLEDDRRIWMISTPRAHKGGIHKHFLRSSQDHFFFKCPCCSRSTELIYPDCLVVVGENEDDLRINESHYICKECKGTLNHKSKIEWLSNGIWVPSFTGRSMRGFHIPQLYSMTVSPISLAQTHFKAMKDPAQETELWNSKVGVPHEVKGARVTDKELEDRVRDYEMFDSFDGDFTTMGVDVGKQLHVVITSWRIGAKANEDINAASESRIIWTGCVDEFEQLDGLMHRYNIRSCVIDANPETRKAREFASRFWGHVHPCWYGRDIKGKVINLNEESQTVTVDRTSWLDCSLSRFRNKTTILPSTLRPEWKEQVKAQVRIYEKDRDGNDRARYITPEGEDHYGHAWNYNEIALPLAYNVGVNRTMSEKVI